MTEAKIIVIDDNAAVLKTLGIVLRGAFTTVVTVGDPKLIPAIIGAGDVDAVLLDMNFGSGRLDGQDGSVHHDLRRCIPCRRVAQAGSR